MRDAENVRTPKDLEKYLVEFPRVIYKRVALWAARFGIREEGRYLFLRRGIRDW